MGITYIYNGKLKDRARELRQGKNLAEALLWRELKDAQFCGLDFTRQAVVDNFIPDFCCESKRIIIEIDGSSHIGREQYDKERDLVLRGAGFKVFRISVDDVKHNIDQTLYDLRKRIESEVLL